MKRIFLFLFVYISLSFIVSLKAQTLLTKDAMNSFAKYSQSHELKELENARKIIDNAYKTRSDSGAFKNNLIRSLIYSTLARVDSNLKYSYKKDPVDETLFSMNYVYGSKFEKNAVEEIAYIKDQLKRTYIFRGNTYFKREQFSEALKYFSILDSLDESNVSVIHNLALLYQELGYYQKSAQFYEKLILKRPKAGYYLVLTNLYEALGDEMSMVRTLYKGTEAYPANRDLVFKLINHLENRNDYKEITKFTEQALKLDETNINLLYLSGFSNEMTGNTGKAEEYYKKILSINPNNYEGNYSLGLLYLNLYLKEMKQSSLLYVSKYYLSKANEIDPNEIKSLTSLSILYKYTGDKDQLQKINNRINQLKLN
jgi:tetratricopeptide (TPR) repeat protein